MNPITGKEAAGEFRSQSNQVKKLESPRKQKQIA